MSEVADLELRVAKEYARKEELQEVVKSHLVNQKENAETIRRMGQELSSQQRTLELLEYRLGGIQGALNRIVWLLVAPVVTGLGYLIIQSVHAFLPW